MTERPALGRRDMILIGASAGGVPLLKDLFARMDPELGASYFVTLHRPPLLDSELAAVLGRRASLPIREPSFGERIARNTIYLAPPDRHMRIDARRILVDRGPKEHHSRPAIDPMFASGALHGARRAVGVLLSGNLSDGVAGLIAIKAAGGVSIVQDPREAEWPQMPRNALLYDHVDFLFTIATLPRLLRELIAGANVDAVDARHLR